MKDETREILDKLKNSVTNPTLAVYFTGDEEIIDNIKCLEPNECKILLAYITNLQKDLDYQKQAEQEYNEKHTKLMNKYKELQEENKRLKELDENYPIEEQLEEALKWKNIYKSRIDKANEYIKENTRWFDSEYAKIYGELVDCAGAKGDRLEVLVKPSNLSKILGGDKDVKEAKD